MTSQPKLLTAERIVAGTATAVFLYTLWRGPERFCYESFGTLILSPEIYTRVLPAPINHWLLSALLHQPALSLVLYAIPVMMLVAAASSAVLAWRHKSEVCAWICCGLVALVFGTYHLLQPLGITFKYC